MLSSRLMKKRSSKILEGLRRFSDEDKNAGLLTIDARGNGCKLSQRADIKRTVRA